MTGMMMMNGIETLEDQVDWLYECGAGFVTAINRPGNQAVQRAGAG